MSVDQDLKAAFKKCIPALAGTLGLQQSNVFLGVVTGVDEDNRTCSIDSSTGDKLGITYNDVHLSMERNDGFINIPAVDSTIAVAKLPNGELYAVGFSDITKQICYIDSNNKYEFSSTGFIWNGGALGGIVKVSALTARLNILENKFNDLITKINAWIPAAGDGGALLKTTLTLWLAAPLTLTVDADTASTKIKQ